MCAGIPKSTKRFHSKYLLTAVSSPSSPPPALLRLWLQGFGEIVATVSLDVLLLGGRNLSSGCLCYTTNADRQHNTREGKKKKGVRLVTPYNRGHGHEENSRDRTCLGQGAPVRERHQPCVLEKVLVFSHALS